MLKATKRHPYRPAHLHFLIAAEGYETLITHLFVAGDQYLDSATRFWRQTIAHSHLHARSSRRGAGWAEDETPWWRLRNDFRLKRVEPPAIQGAR
jgi:hydroxyquinol 1,2-dioxygenase